MRISEWSYSVGSSGVETQIWERSAHALSPGSDYADSPGTMNLENMWGH